MRAKGGGVRACEARGIVSARGPGDHPHFLPLGFNQARLQPPIWECWAPRGLCSATASTCKCPLNNPYVIFTPPGTSSFCLHTPFARKSAPAKFDLVLYACYLERRLHCKNHLLSFYCVTAIVVGTENR